jgi:hypothetical protein
MGELPSAALTYAPTPKFEDCEPWNGKQGIPTIYNCDLDNPRQAFLWTYTCPPKIVGAPLVWPVTYYEYLSYRQWQLGVRPVHPPELAYVATSTNILDTSTAAGKWYPVDEVPELATPDIGTVFDSMSIQDRIALKEAVLNRLNLNTEVAQGNTVKDVAYALVVNPDRLVDALRNLGIDATVETIIDDEMADRIAVIVGRVEAQ